MEWLDANGIARSYLLSLRLRNHNRRNDRKIVKARGRACMQRIIIVWTWRHHCTHGLVAAVTVCTNQVCPNPQPWWIGAREFPLLAEEPLAPDGWLWMGNQVFVFRERPLQVADALADGSTHMQVVVIEVGWFKIRAERQWWWGDDWEGKAKGEFDQKWRIGFYGVLI